MEDPKDKIGPRVKPRELFVARDDNPFVALKDFILAFGETPEAAVANLFEGHKHRDQLERFFGRARASSRREPEVATSIDEMLAVELRKGASDARVTARAPSQLTHPESESPLALRRAAGQLDNIAERLAPRARPSLVPNPPRTSRKQ